MWVRFDTDALDIPPGMDVDKCQGQNLEPRADKLLSLITKRLRETENVLDQILPRFGRQQPV